MKKFLSILFILSLSHSSLILAQDSEDSDTPEVSTVEALLMLVKENYKEIYDYFQRILHIFHLFQFLIL